MKLTLMNYSREPYDRFASKLWQLCRSRFGTSAIFNPAVAFCASDPTQGNAVLCLTKHFGIFPQDIGDSYCGIELHEVSRLLEKPGVAVIIQSVSPSTLRYHQRSGSSDSAQRRRNEPRTEDNVQSHLATLTSTTDSGTGAALPYLSQEISDISNFLLGHRKLSGQGFLYIAGFNQTKPVADNDSIPAGSFLPWYLVLSGQQGKWRIYHQPEVEKLFERLPGDNPNAIDLEKLIAQMDSDTPLE